MPNIWVVNASPVITLAKAGHLALLTELADEVLLLMLSCRNYFAAAASHPARQAIERGWGNHISIVDVPAVMLGGASVPGEAAVLAAVLQAENARQFG